MNQYSKRFCISDFVYLGFFLTEVFIVIFLKVTDGYKMELLRERE